MQKVKPFYIPLKEPYSTNILNDTPGTASEQVNDPCSHYRKIRESLPDNATMNLDLYNSVLSHKSKSVFAKEEVKKYV